MEETAVLDRDFSNIYEHYSELVRLIKEKKDMPLRMKEHTHSANQAYLERMNCYPKVLYGRENRATKFNLGQDSNFLNETGLRRADSKELCLEIDLVLSTLCKYKLEELAVSQKKAI